MVDVKLIIRCKKGDMFAFEKLYEICSSKAFRTVFSIVNRYDLAEDILQETFCECFRNIKKLHAPEAFEIWFYRILVRNSWKMLYNEKKFFHKQLEAWENSMKDPHNCFEDIESTDLLNAINRLSLPMKTTVILHYYNDLPVKEIAKIMDCFEGTVKSRLFNSRKILAKELKKQSAEFSGKEYI